VKHFSWPARTGLALLSVGAAAIVAAPAEAATTGTVSVEKSSMVAYVTSPAATTRHNVSITRSGRTVTVDDSVPVRAGAGCSAVSGDSTKARCTLKVDPTWLRVRLGEGDDVLVNRTDLSMSANTLNGNDRITGGPKRDILKGDIGNDDLSGYLGNDIEDGGPGNDWFIQSGDPGTTADADSFIGGSGLDQVSYFARSKPVTADADAVRGDDGAAGEHDTIGASVEAIMGGGGNDRLLGTSRVDYVYGSAGNDRLDGGTGRDYLNGAGGVDVCDHESGDTILGCES
jgi:hypothetical protein